MVTDMVIMAKKAFTLIEVLVNIALLAILMAITLVAINPAGQINKSKDIKRKADIKSIANSISQYTVDNEAQLPLSLNGTPIPTGPPGYEISKVGLDICYALVPYYLAALPHDPNVQSSDITDCNSSYLTGYFLYNASKSNNVTLVAPYLSLNVLTPTPTLTPLIPTDTPIPTIPSGPPPTNTPIPTSPPVTSSTYYVATTGSNSNPGTLAQPFATVQKGLTTLQAGDTLIVRGGTYIERIRNPSIQSGTAVAPVLVKNYPGETPVVQGLFWLSGADYWKIDGVNMTWDMATGQANEHMVKMSGGTNWTITNAEIWNAHSFAGVLVSSGATNWTISYSYIHDTADCQTQCSGTGSPHTANQDHLVYLDNTNNGTITRNIFVNSPNGRGIKLGPPSSGPDGPDHITMSYNTFYNNLGPSNIQLSYGSHDNTMTFNILQKPQTTSKYNIMNNNLGAGGNGTNNIALKNVGWQSAGVVESDSTFLIDGGSNLYIDPQLDASWHPQNPAAQSYGRFAP